MKRLSERVAAFLAGDGERVVRGQLRRHGLQSHHLDDVVEGTLWRALRAEQNDPEFEPDSLERWTSRLVQRQTRDVLRARNRRWDHEAPVADRLGTDDGAAESFWDQQYERDERTPGEEVEFETIDLAYSAQQVDRIRRRVGEVLATRPSPAAAALCLVTMLCDGAEPAEDCPTPRGGVSPEQAQWWAAVFYSGSVNCFPLNGTEEDQAMRTRRSRAVRHTRAVLEEATHG